MRLRNERKVLKILEQERVRTNRGRMKMDRQEIKCMEVWRLNKINDLE